MNLIRNSLNLSALFLCIPSTTRPPPPPPPLHTQHTVSRLTALSSKWKLTRTKYIHYTHFGSKERGPGTTGQILTLNWPLGYNEFDFFLENEEYRPLDGCKIESKAHLLNMFLIFWAVFCAFVFKSFQKVLIWPQFFLNQKIYQKTQNFTLISNQFLSLAFFVKYECKCAGNSSKKGKPFLWICLKILLGNHLRVCKTKLLKSLYPVDHSPHYTCGAARCI